MWFEIVLVTPMLLFAVTLAWHFITVKTLSGLTKCKFFSLTAFMAEKGFFISLDDYLLTTCFGLLEVLTWFLFSFLILMTVLFLLLCVAYAKITGAVVALVAACVLLRILRVRIMGG